MKKRLLGEKVEFFRAGFCDSKKYPLRGTIIRNDVDGYVVLTKEYGHRLHVVEEEIVGRWK